MEGKKQVMIPAYQLERLSKQPKELDWRGSAERELEALIQAARPR